MGYYTSYRLTWTVDGEQPDPEDIIGYIEAHNRFYGLDLVNDSEVSGYSKWYRECAKIVYPTFEPEQLEKPYAGDSC
jgi:hypothetical protein